MDSATTKYLSSFLWSNNFENSSAFVIVIIRTYILFSWNSYFLCNTSVSTFNVKKYHLGLSKLQPYLRFKVILFCNFHIFCSLRSYLSLTDSPSLTYATTRWRIVSQTVPLKDRTSTKFECHLSSISKWWV